MSPGGALVRSFLRDPLRHSWTVQGFGMIRAYLDDEKRWRLNLWDDRLAVPGASVVHDHPWDFTSYVIFGEIHNLRYVADRDDKGEPYAWCRIKTGEVGGAVSQPSVCRLAKYSTELYLQGNVYQQHKEEIHRTLAPRGTVTLNDRSPPTIDYTVRVFWKTSTDFVPVRPRPATTEEVLNACHAVKTWYDAEKSDE